MTRYSRAAPSPRYRQLLEQYRLMHTQGETHLGIPPEHTFPGASLPRQAPHIRRLVRRCGARTILDYGSGKGLQYGPHPMADATGGVDYPDIQSYWGVAQIRCYDPGYAPFAELPSGSFHGVICTDVLEHIPEEDIPWILEDLFGFARKFVFANVACFPALKRLPSGENSHCTIRPVRWWEEHVQRAARTKPEIVYEVRFVYPKGQQLVESVIDSG